MVQLSDAKIAEMKDLCQRMLERSYCIYSKFRVASVLVTDDGTMITGCNVENASYGLCICAERTAAVKAVSEGHLKFIACMVLTNAPKRIAPCGACRQFLAEFGCDMDIYMVSNDLIHEKRKLSELLPLAFTPSELESGLRH